MSRKKGETTLIIPGRETWELWKVTPSGTELSLVSETTDVHELKKDILTGETILFFPVSKLTFAPFSAETTDENLYDDLVESHWEQLGIRLSSEDGVLSDYHVLEKTPLFTILAPFSLSPQTEQDLPARLPSYFDIAPHAYSVKNDTLVFHKQLGKWCLSFYRGGKIFFASVLGEHLDEEAIRGANMVLIQLQLQGCCPPAFSVDLWSDDPAPSFMAPMLNRPVHAKKVPSPELPTVRSRILPADVHAERRKKATGRRIKLITTVALIVYAVVVVTHVRTVVDLKKDVADLKPKHTELNADFAMLEELKAKWKTLSPAVDSSLWPDDILWCCYNANPDPKTLRFTFFEVKSDEKTGQPMTISIKGTAPDPQPITKFGQNLKSAQYKLDYYLWEIPSPTPSSKEGEPWNFSFQAKTAETVTQ